MVGCSDEVRVIQSQVNFQWLYKATVEREDLIAA